MSGAAQLLAPEGIFTLIAPAEYSEQLINEGDKVRLYPTEQYLIRHNYRKPVKRTILSFSNKIPKTTDTHEVILAEGNERSEWYENVTKDFYIIK